MRNAASQRGSSVCHLLFHITFNSNQCRCIHINWKAFILYAATTKGNEWMIPLRQINIKKNDSIPSFALLPSRIIEFTNARRFICIFLKIFINSTNNLFDLICPNLPSFRPFEFVWWFSHDKRFVIFMTHSRIFFVFQWWDDSGILRTTNINFVQRRSNPSTRENLNRF